MKHEHLEHRYFAGLPITERGFFMLALCSTTVLLLVDLVYPFTPDNGLYQSMGLQLVRYGRLPFIGTWDTNFPGIVFLHALAISLFGNSELAFRLIDVAAHIGIATVIFQISKRWFSPRTAFITSLLSTLYYIALLRNFAGERDGFVALFILLAISLLLGIRDRVEAANIGKRQKGIPIRLFLVGLLAGVSFVIRPTYALIGISIFVSVFFIPFQKKWLAILLYSIGVALPILAVLIIYATVPNGLQEFYLATIRFNLDVYGNTRYRFGAIYALKKPAEVLENALLLAAIIVAFFTRRRDRGVSTCTLVGRRNFGRFEMVLFGSLYLSTKLSPWSMGKFYLYHYEPSIVLTLFIAAYVIECLLGGSHGARSTSEQRFGTKNSSILLALLLLALVLIAYPWHIATIFVQSLGQKQSTIARYMRDNIDPPGEYTLRSTDELADYLALPKNLGGKLESCSMDEAIGWMTGRESASRFSSSLPIGLLTPTGDYTSYQLKWRREYVDSIKSGKPTLLLIAIGPGSNAFFLPATPAEILHSLPSFDSVLQSDYRFDTLIHHWQVYRRK